MTDQAVDTGGIEVPQQGQRGAPAPSQTAPPFIGRAQELKELWADIGRAGLDTLAGRKAPRARVLLIAGRPGSGRTALAEEFAGRVTGPGSRYPGGVLRARLTEPDGTPVPTADVARTLLGDLHLSAAPGATEDDVTGMLRDALVERPSVLLLDDAAHAEQVDPLLPDTPHCLAVAVSEGPLTGIPDVRPCTLGGLDTPSAVALLSRFTGSVRITCDPRSAEHLAEECGRMPAALLLAGGWLSARPRAAVADLAKRLREAPARGDGSPLARVFAFVYAELPTPAARVLRLLSLAPAGLADPQTASALAGCSVTTAHDVLDDLAVLGLVRPAGTPLPQYEVPGCLMPLLRRRTEAQDRPAELQLARARMLERNVTLLQSCRALTEPAGSAARRKHAALPNSLRFPSRTAAARWLRIRQPALLAAARAAVAEGDLDTLARRLMAALARALTAHQGTEAAAAELYGIHALMLCVTERRGLHREQAAALLNLADLDAHAGHTRAALARYRAALDAGRQAQDPYATGRAMESIGAAYQELLDAQRAVDWFGRALAQCLARDERHDAARLYGRIAGAQVQDGRYAEALRSWRAAVAGFRKAGDLAGQARALSELARTQEYAGRYEEALRTGREAVEGARRAHDERLQAALQLRLADAFERLGDPVAAGLHRAAAERVLGGEAGEEASDGCTAPVSGVCGDSADSGVCGDSADSGDSGDSGDFETSGGSADFGGSEDSLGSGASEIGETARGPVRDGLFRGPGGSRGAPADGSATATTARPPITPEPRTSPAHVPGRRRDDQPDDLAAGGDDGVDVAADAGDGLEERRHDAPASRRRGDAEDGSDRAEDGGDRAEGGGPEGDAGGSGKGRRLDLPASRREGHAPDHPEDSDRPEDPEDPEDPDHPAFEDAGTAPSPGIVPGPAPAPSAAPGQHVTATEEDVPGDPGTASGPAPQRPRDASRPDTPDTPPSTCESHSASAPY